MVPSIPYLKKKIESAFLVWFQNSNSYLRLEEPAWFVFRRITRRFRAETIAAEFALRYGLSIEESNTFVQDISCRTELMNRAEPALDAGQLVSKPTLAFRMNRTEPALDSANQSITEGNEHHFLPWSTYHYRLGNRGFTFFYETQAFEDYLHPLISHLGIPDKQDDCPLFELFAFHERIVFRFNGEVKGSWTIDETHLVKGMIFMFLVNVMHNKTDADWLMTVHASAITNGKKTILFTAAPGNGKTTIAALLQSRGYRIIADDFVPIERNSLKTWPFPIAMSVKEGSMELLSPLMPGLLQKPVNCISPEKSVRYLPPAGSIGESSEAFPVREIILISYNPEVDLVWEKLDTLSGVKLFLDQAWVSPGRENAQAFLDRIVPLPFYQLTYSNNEKALEVLTKLFDHD